MLMPFRTAAVLGAGVMGTQIAAHLANAGLTVHLLDLPGPGDSPNALVEAALAKGRTASPPLFFSPSVAQRVVPGNYDQDFDRLADVDWVIEAVVEDLAIKRQLMARLEAVVADHAVISTNTSGLPIHQIAAERSPSFRRRFLGTHFFNPPRYLKLLELIPTPETDPQVLERVQAFSELYLGKGVVVAKDTPAFIGNRIGLFTILLGVRALAQGYTIAEIDTLTGPLVGRPKSATFRTADLVGLDILRAVAMHLYPAVPQDEHRELFQVPDLLHKLVETGSLGAKTSQGFYKKVQGQILTLNPKTLAYEPPPPIDLGDLEAITALPDLGERLQRLYLDQGRAGQFFRDTTLALIHYSAHRIPEIADDPADIDRAMAWGFGWELGPFALWQSLGVERVQSDLAQRGLTLPDWIELWQQQGQVQAHPKRVPMLRHLSPALDLKAIGQDPQRILWQNAEAALVDLGDGVVLYEFRSKGNTLSFKVIEGLATVLDRLEAADWHGLVIGNASANFCGGANLIEMAGLAQQGRLAAIEDLIGQFQSLLQRLHYFPKPIVAAVQGRALGGGCELVMACPQVVAAAESYIGLVELSVGLIPGAGGIMRLAAWASERAASEQARDVQPFLSRAFATIAMAKVSGSALEAQEWGFLSPTARVVIKGEDRLSVAKEEVLRLSRGGYRPPAPRLIRVLGRPGRAVLEHGAYLFQAGGYISEYDRELAHRLALVITGGDLSSPAWVSEDHLLALERQQFVPLLGEPKTQARIAHLLQTKKPLRN